MANAEALEQAVAQFRSYPSNELLDMAGSPNWALLTHQAIREVLRERGLDAPPIPDLPEAAYIEPSFQPSDAGDGPSEAMADPDRSGSAAGWHGGRRSSESSDSDESDRRRSKTRPPSALRLILGFIVFIIALVRFASACNDLRLSYSGSDAPGPERMQRVPPIARAECDRRSDELPADR